jgi:hypothetical protein
MQNTNLSELVTEVSAVKTENRELRSILNSQHEMMNAMNVLLFKLLNKMHSSSDDTITTEPAVDQNELSVEQNDLSVDQNETTVDQNETTVDQNETAVDQNETAVDQNETAAVDQNETAVDQNETAVTEPQIQESNEPEYKEKGPLSPIEEEVATRVIKPNTLRCSSLVVSFCTPM